MEQAQTTRTVTCREACGTWITYTLVCDGTAYGFGIRTPEEQVCVPKLTSDSARAVRLSETFADNLVFPCQALEILDDLLAEGEI